MYTWFSIEEDNEIFIHVGETRQSRNLVAIEFKDMDELEQFKESIIKCIDEIKENYEGFD